MKENYLESIKHIPEQVEIHSKKIDEYASGYGAVFFFEDEKVINEWYERMPPFKSSKSFDTWSENATGMLQFVVWTALEKEGFGASSN